MEIIKNLKYFYGLSGLIYKNNLFIEFLDIIDLIIKIPSFVHPLIAKLKLALLTQVDYSIDIDKYNFKEKKFSHFLNIIFDLIMEENIEGIKDIEFSKLTDQQIHELERLKIFYIENEREKLFKEEEYKKKATSIFREARENQSLIEKLKEIFTPDEIKSILNDDPALLINRFTKKYYDSKAETDRCLKRLIELFKSNKSNKTIDKTTLNEYLKSKTETDRLKKLEYLNFDISIDDVFLRSTNSTKLQKNILEFTKLIKAFKETVYSSTFKKKIKYYDFFNKMSTNYKPEISSSEITKRENIIKGTEEELQNQRIDKAMYNNKYYQNKFYLYLLFDGLGFNSKSFIDELQDSLSSGASDILIIRHLFTDTLVEFLDFFSSGNFTNKPKDWLSGLSGIMIFFNWQNGYCHNINSYDKSKKEFTLKLDNMYSSLEDIPTKEFAKKLAAAEAAKLAAAEAAKLAAAEAAKLAAAEAAKLAAAEAEKLAAAEAAKPSAETKGWSKYVKNMPKLLSPFGTKKPPTTTTGVPEGPNSGGTTKASERPNPTTTTGVPERLNSGETTKAPEGPNLGGTTGVPY